jgi:hypothetical protein
MQPINRLIKITLGPAFLLLAAFSLHAQAENPSATVPIRAVVTVVGKNYTEAPKITKDDVQVYDGKDKLTVSEWTPAQGDRGKLDFAVVIDEETSTDLGLQLNDIKDFIKETPNGTRVAVFYAANGTVKIAQDFTADHDAAAKSVRLPMGNGGAYSSDYLSVIDLMKRWPETGGRREMLLVADGIDRFRGDFPSSPDLDNAIARAQRSGIIIHTIFARGVGFVGRNFFRASLGQSNLSKIAEETGGESFFQGMETPIAYAPFLKQLNFVLNNQYLVTALDKPNKKAGLRRIRIRTEIGGVDISAPESWWVPAVGGGAQ